MSKLTDRITYLKGMAAGMKLNMDKDANKLLMEMLALMGEMAEEMAAMAGAQSDLNEYVESIDDDLADLEETLFGDSGEEDDVEADEDAEDEDELDEEADVEVDDLILYACPHCGHELEFRTDDVDFDEDYPCPNCGKPIFPEVEEDE